MKTVKTGALAICAALLLTAVAGASLASAAQFRAEEYPTAVTGTQTVAQKFTTWEKGPTWTCSTVTSTGTIAAGSNTLSLTPTYSGCQAFGQAATVKMNSCKYVFNNSNEAGVNTGTMDISCSKEGDEIEVAASICTMKLPAQTAKGPVQYSEAAGLQGYQRKLNVTPNATGFKYSLSGFVCGKVGTFEDGALSGNMLVRGTNQQHEVGLYLNIEQGANFPMFVAESYPETVNANLAEAPNGFNFPNITVFSCATLLGNGLISSVPDGQLTLGLMAWSGCGLTINRNGCSFTLAGPISGAGSLALECPAGKELTINAPWSCNISIPSQGGLGSVKYTKAGSGSTRTITAKVEVKNLKYTAPFPCNKTGTFQNGELLFDWVIKGYTYYGSRQVEGMTEYLAGPQKGVWYE